jgi:hypothetical protein
MGEPLLKMVAGMPQARLNPLVAGYTGDQVEGARTSVHRSRPSRHLTFTVTTEDTVDLATADRQPHLGPGSHAGQEGRPGRSPVRIAPDDPVSQVSTSLSTGSAWPCARRSTSPSPGTIGDDVRLRRRAVMVGSPDVDDKLHMKHRR